MPRDLLANFALLMKTVCTLILLSCAVIAHADIPEVALAMKPMSGSVNVHPNVLISLSIDRSASRAAYLIGHDQYDRNRGYLGYFNSGKCYGYQGGNRNVADGYFYILRDADALHECSQSFSGNFMNWATSSLLDILRYALTGGDRVVDTSQASILQRAVLSEHSYADPHYFPRKVLNAGVHSSTPNRVTPFNVQTLFIVSCRNRILFSDVQGVNNDCDTPAYESKGRLAQTDKRLGEYLARVQVCDRREGMTRTDLCREYGSHHKPVGVIQRYADALRFSVMGYLLDDAETRYGGVLRSPMHYLGQYEFSSPDFMAKINAASEWDPDTGVLYSSPGSKMTGDQNSGGVINYINRIGRSGKYRQFDPIGELYYEGLRYLQGKPPTQAAYDGVLNAMKEEFSLPAVDGDPVTAACQRNYLVGVGDANTHWDRYLPGNQRTLINGLQSAYDPVRPVEPAEAGKTPALDVKAWTAKVGEMEADVAGHYSNPSRRANLNHLELLDTGEHGHGTYYMSGLAYWANTRDIRHDKPVRVRTLVVDLDDRGNGKLDGGQRTVKPQDSQLFLAAKYGGFRDANMDGNPFVTYAADGSTLARLSTEEWSSGTSGLPETYLLGGDPRRLIEGTRSMFAMLANDGSDSFTETARHNVLVPSAESERAGSMLYQAGFNRMHWSGSLKKFSVNINGEGEASRSATPLWDAGIILSGTPKRPPAPLPDERKIYTSSVQAGKLQRTVEFRWQALDANQRMALNKLADEAASDDLGAQRVDYLRGVRALEAWQQDGIFRSRRSVLGDIVNSIPVHASAPASISQDIEYPDFHAKYGQRAKTVYIGSNDGMLHAFDAESGAELFAYIPNALVPWLSLLTDPGYTHRPFVDGGIAVADAKVGGKWRTVLAAGMGAGAQGVFALDVSDPAHFGEGLGAIWEFTDSDDPDIGNVMGPPQIAKFRTQTSEGIGDYEYFVVVPSGVNNYKADGAGRHNTTGQQALFLLSLQKDPSSPWKLGVNYHKINLPVGEARLQNGLSQPVLAGSPDGAVRHAYAGDLQGNLWRFDFKDGPPWSRALGTNPKPLFIARDGEGRRQPIATQPKIVYATGNAYMVLFGTGKFLEASDAAPGGFAVQSFYGIMDRPELRSSIEGRAALSPRILAASSSSNEILLAQSGKAGIHVASNSRGWFFDFPESEKSGERIVSNPVTAFGRLFLSTLIPSASPCKQDSGRMYVLDTLTGLPANGSAMGYTLEPGDIGSPQVLRDGMEVIGPQTGARRKAKKRYSLLDPNPNGSDPPAGKRHPSAQGQVTTQAGRLSWREITNWQELRDEALGR